VSAVARVGVVGAGTMGSGIAELATRGGYEALVHDPDPAALESVRERDGVHPAPSLADLDGCDLVVEAAPEDLGLKQRLFTDLAAACGPEAILATNTSSLRVAEIAAGVPRPERIVGMHFFNPPTRMRLVEVVATEAAAGTVLAAVTAVAERMGRTPIRAKDSPGFVANRLARPFTLESLRMLAEGVADAETIARVCRVGGGFRMGPFELIDLIGLDVNLSVARSFYRQGGEPERWRPSAIQEELVAAGRLGRKSRHGFYEYPPSPSGASLPSAVRERRTGVDGVESPTLDPGELARIDPAGPEILPRLVAQIANEAAFAREEEIAAPADMDTAMRLGFNWPLGPLEWTELIGADRAAALLEALRQERGEAYRPAPSLALA